MINYSFSIQDLEFYLLIVTRVSCFVFAAPFYATTNVPRRVKVIFSLLVAFLLYRYIVPHMYVEYHTVLGYAILVIKEAMAGILLGFSTNMCTYIIQFVGHLIDVDMGLSMVQLFDPVSRMNTGFSGTLYQYAFLIIICVTDIYQWLFRAFIESYQWIPTGRIAFDVDHLFNSMVTFFGEFFSIGFRLFLPMFGVMLLLNAVLGILAKIAPQMNMFTVGMQLKVLIGLSVLYLTMVMLPAFSDFIYGQMKIMFEQFAGGMYAQ